MSEKSESRRDGSRLQPNSGRGMFRKADAILYDLSIDQKEAQSSFQLTRKVWAKVCTDALQNGLDYVPALKIIMGTGNVRTRLAIIEWSHLEYLKSIEQQYLKEQLD